MRKRKSCLNVRPRKRWVLELEGEGEGPSKERTGPVSDEVDILRKMQTKRMEW